MRVTWSPLAIDRAAEAAAYIAKDSPTAARRWVDELFKAAASLARLPERGRRVPELPRPDLRELLFGNYRIVYRIEPRRIAILTVRHLRRRFDPADVE
jgi:plasmid stabilization system protein ParE